jgi:hypothetical protein
MKSFTAVVAFALSTLSCVNAHGYIIDPPAEFISTYIKTKYEAILTASSDPAFGGLKWDDSPLKNTNTFTAAFKKTSYTSLRQYLDKAVPGCGNTRMDVSAKDVTSKTQLKWGNDEYREGFTPSHNGPCEVWIDDMRMLQNDNCAVTYQGYPAVLPVDFSKCQGSCTLRLYWLAMHQPDWQVYKQCVPIVNKNATPPPTTTTTPPTTTTTTPPTTTWVPTPPPTTPQPTVTGLACNYEGKIYKVCRNSNYDGWQYENGGVCVGITRCIKQSPPYGIVRSS